MAGAVLAAGVALVLIVSRGGGPPVPQPDTSSMEAQVAEKIARTRDLVASDPREPAMWGRMGMVFHAHELFSEAAESYARAAELDDADFRWPYLRAQVLKELRELDDARHALALALSLNPSYAPLHVLDAELLESAGDTDGADGAYRRAIAADARTAPAHFGLGRSRLADGALDESQAHLETAASLAPQAGAIQATLARLYRRQGDREKALRAATLARTLHPEVTLDDPVMAAVGEEGVSIVGIQSRAVEAESKGDSVRAEALLRQMIALRPEDANFYYNLANNLARQGRFDEARASYQDALSRAPDHVAAHINLGNVLAQAEDWGRAESSYRRALEIEPEHAGALSSLAKTAIHRGDRAQAETYLRRSIDSDPTRAEAHYILGQLLRGDERLGEAIASFERALELAPHRGDIIAEHAITLAQHGDFAEAWRYTHRAQSLGWTAPPDFLAALRARLPEPQRE